MEPEIPAPLNPTRRRDRGAIKRQALRATTLMLPQEQIVWLRARAARRNKNVSWVLTELIAEARTREQDRRSDGAAALTGD